MKKMMMSCLGVILICLLATPSLHAQDLDIPAQHAIAVEVETGKILYEKNANQPAYIASLTKLLTAYLVYEAIETGKIRMEDRVFVSDYPYYLTGQAGISNVNLDARYYTVEELLTATLLSSANSAAITLAEAVSGSEAAFVTLMEETVKKWGITDAEFVNVSGLSNEWLGENKSKGADDTENKLSARSLAIIVRKLLQDYPEVLEITSKSSYQLNGYTYYTTNQLLPDLLYGRPGVDGLKTGTSEKAGSSLITSSYQQNMRIITVILNADDGADNPENRFLAANQLLNHIYDQYTLATLVSKGEDYRKSAVPIFNGATATLSAHATEDLHVVIHKYTGEEVTASFVPTHKELDAPVQKGTSLGSLVLNDQETSYLDGLPQVEMVAAKTLKPASWPISWWNHFVRYVNEKL